MHEVSCHAIETSFMSLVRCQHWNSLLKYAHARSVALFLELPGSAGTCKVIPVWIILLKQETVSGSGIS